MFRFDEPSSDISLQKSYKERKNIDGECWSVVTSLERCRQVTAGWMEIDSGPTESCLLACLLNMPRLRSYNTTN